MRAKRHAFSTITTVTPLCTIRAVPMSTSTQSPAFHYTTRNLLQLSSSFTSTAASLALSASASASLRASAASTQPVHLPAHLPSSPLNTSASSSSPRSSRSACPASGAGGRARRASSRARVPNEVGEWGWASRGHQHKRERSASRLSPDSPGWRREWDGRTYRLPPWRGPTHQPGTLPLLAPATRSRATRRPTRREAGLSEPVISQPCHADSAQRCRRCLPACVRVPALSPSA